MSAERCQNLLESLLEYSCRPEFAGQMEIARELFAIATGKTNDEDPFYESRMRVFQHWFIFDFRLSEVASGSTVFEVFLERGQSVFPTEELCAYEQFRSMRRSLFRVEKPVGDAILVSDIFSHSAALVFPLPDFLYTGFDPGRLFEGRLISFLGRNYFTGAFIFHPDEVRGLIEKQVREFIYRRTYEPAVQVNDWKTEIRRRHELLIAVTEQKRVLETGGDRKKSIEVLNVSKNLAQVANEFGTASFVVALGNAEAVSPFVAETPFYDVGPIIDSLAYSELRCNRYRHIVPERLYTFERRDTLSQPPRSLMERSA